MMHWWSQAQVIHRRTNQKFLIKQLTPKNTRDLTFPLEDPEGKDPPRDVFLVDYFRDKYQREIRYKDLPSLDIGKALFLKKISLARPIERRETICEMVRAEDGPCGAITSNFEIGVDRNMTCVWSYPSCPDLKLGGQSRVPVDDKCQWNLVGKSVLVMLKSSSNMAHAADRKITGRLQMIVCVMAAKHNGYKYLKWVSETKIGIINAKLGGSNMELMDRLPNFGGGDNVMFIGADVNHPAARNKRDTIRLFPEGSPANVPPGTVVNLIIVHPSDFDFYLCSHFGGLGTSKPTHYHVLWDENGFNSDCLQKHIQHVFHFRVVTQKPVSLVPPVYYADLVAYRGRMFKEVLMEMHSSGSTTSSHAASGVISFNSFI
ncbi:hypothetical protein HAX54_004494 [Datura stramonium]|uniref:Piwi domain-containing protein n=1 Tax=Datura stramonium TaxID=4076 RepID=A0ABS8WVZ7_DATST|nr:hypothetical protein [Datura stramonium]